jgi:uncharacterized protein (TIGR02145 family)
MIKRFLLKSILILAGVLLTVSAFCQAPQSFKYQAVLRDASGNILSSSSKTIEVDILQGTITGTVVFTETHNITTNEQGVININIGSVNATDFAAINWSSGAYFIRIKVDGTDMGTSQLLSVPYALYSSKAGNGFSGSYADLSNKPSWSDSINNKIKSNKDTIRIDTTITDSIKIETTKIDTIKIDSTKIVTISGTQTITGDKTFSGNTSFSNTISASNGINVNNKNITNLSAPINSNDAATKAYVDALLQRLERLELTTGIKVKDFDGNIYNTTIIGTQTWMVDNLKTTHYANGTQIPLITLYGIWSAQTSGACAYYDNNPANADTFGLLYNYFTVIDSSNICPTGWHVPSDSDWNSLVTLLGGAAGGALKETGLTHWASPNLGATNSSGFTGLPGGFRYGSGGAFDHVDLVGKFWTTTANDSTNSWYRELNYNAVGVGRISDLKTSGFSVRCIKN